MSGDACNLVANGPHKPDITLGVWGYAGRCAKRCAISCRNGKLGDLARSGDTPDLVAPEFGKPEVAIEARSYNERFAFRVGDRKLGDMAGSGDAPDLFAEHLGEPKVAIGTSGDAERNAVRGRDGKLG